MKNFLTTLLIIIAGTALSLIIGLAIMAISRFEAPISDGQQVGFITAMDKQGYFWKTETAFLKTDLLSGQEDAYCVISEDVKLHLRVANTYRTKVEIAYARPSWVGPWECGHEYAVITAVKAVE